MVSLDSTQNVIEEAIRRNCNLVVAHHPIIFSGLKRIGTADYVGRAVTAAIRHEVAVYAIHTNLDNVLTGVNGKMAEILGLKNIEVLQPRPGVLKKLSTFIPIDHLEHVRQALFIAGGGHVGNYSECSFEVQGIGTFKAGEGADPFVGRIGTRHEERESRLEMVFHAHLESTMVRALKASHPYEEVAYDVVSLSNNVDSVGSGLIGDTESEMEEMEFLHLLKERFRLQVLRHTTLTGTKVNRVAVCGGSGSFLIQKALAAEADIFVTSDVKYHEFFDANGKMVIADIGHYESEQFTINLLFDLLQEKFPNFAVLKSGSKTNPVQYLI
jgi:dinuclear metal center YbgI/SA1388 family protein